MNALQGLSVEPKCRPFDLSFSGDETYRDDESDDEKDLIDCSTTFPSIFLMMDQAATQSSSASMRAARTAPSASTGLKRAGLCSSAIIASAIMSGVDVANSRRRPAA